MSDRSEYHKQYRLKNKEKLNDYHKKYYHIKKNNDIDDKSNIEKKEKIETEPIKKYDFTAKPEAAFKKMVAARKKKLEELKEKQGINKMYDKGYTEMLATFFKVNFNSEVKVLFMKSYNKKKLDI